MKIHYIRRVTNSKMGNPRYEIRFTDGEKTLTGVTKNDSSINYSIADTAVSADIEYEKGNARKNIDVTIIDIKNQELHNGRIVN